MKSRLIIIITLLLGSVMIYMGCKKESPSVVSLKDIQGKWSQEYNATPDLTMPPNYRLIHFLNDSFYMQFDWSTETLTSNCPEGKGTAFVKGKFDLKDSKIYIDGIYSTANYEVNSDSSGCLLVGNRVDSFLVKSFTENQLTLYWLVPSSNMPENHKTVILSRL